MADQKYPTSETPSIHISACGGDLQIRAWPEAAVLVEGDDMNVTEDKSGFTIESKADLRLMVPEQAAIAVGAAARDLIIKNVKGDLSLGEISGDIVLRRVGHVKLNGVGRDVSAKYVDGRLTATDVQGDVSVRRAQAVQLQSVKGDVEARYIEGDFGVHSGDGDISARSINGDVTIASCRRDVNLRRIDGLTTVENVAGDIRLKGSLPDGSHHLQAQGDIVLSWPHAAALSLTAQAPSIKCRLQLDKEQQVADTLTGRLGDGGAELTLQANGRIIIKETQMVDSHWQEDMSEAEMLGFDFSELGAQISAQVNEKVARVTEEIAARFGPDFTDHISQRVARETQRATQRAERAQRRAERKSTRRGTTATAGAAAPARASQEEQMKILKMVETGVITPAEASTLLEALEK